MKINLTDNIPVQKNYNSTPKPLYPEVKQYIEDLLNRKFIRKSKSAYSSPVVCGRRTVLYVCSLFIENSTDGLLWIVISEETRGFPF
jgi:hypothetical protein